jgi:NAD(P)-dependent dehydrogenase (short-subunit alcohol dehydrogenase family)
MLLGGATVIATRFPVDSALRFLRRKTFRMGTSFKIHGLDLTHSSVEIFCNFIEQKYERLDILINNAAQTVRRPAILYPFNGKRSADKCLTKAYTGLLLDHAACLQELKVLTQSFF